MGKAHPPAPARRQKIQQPPLVLRNARIAGTCARNCLVDLRISQHELRPSPSHWRERKIQTSLDRPRRRRQNERPRRYCGSAQAPARLASMRQLPIQEGQVRRRPTGLLNLRIPLPAMHIQGQSEETRPADRLYSLTRAALGAGLPENPRERGCHASIDEIHQLA